MGQDKAALVAQIQVLHRLVPALTLRPKTAGVCRVRGLRDSNDAGEPGKDAGLLSISKLLFFLGQPLFELLL